MLESKLWYSKTVPSWQSVPNRLSYEDPSPLYCLPSFFIFFCVFYATSCHVNCDLTQMAWFLLRV